MKRLKTITFFIFLVVGILTLFSEDVSKLNYAVLWITLMTDLFIGIFTLYGGT